MMELIESIEEIAEDSIRFEASPRALIHNLEEQISKSYAIWTIWAGVCLLILLLVH